MFKPWDEKNHREHEDGRWVASVFSQRFGSGYCAYVMVPEGPTASVSHLSSVQAAREVADVLLRVLAPHGHPEAS